MFYAVLRAPEFRLQAVLRHSPELKGEPFALVDATGTKSRILESRADAVDAGMTLTQATARCPGLQLKAPNLAQEISAQEILLQTAQGLSPFVESTSPGVITVELPLERRFTAEDFQDQIITPLKELGLDVVVGMAANADLALLASRHAEPIQIVKEPRSFLRPLPVGALAPSPELATVLSGWGIRTIGALTALPMGDVCARLGHEAVALWERAKGGQVRPLRTVKAAEVFEERTDLEYSVETLEPLLFLLRRFLDQISRRLEQAYLVAGSLRLVLRFDDGTRYERAFPIPAPTRNIDLLFRMLHTHLENFTATSPIVGLDLEATPARPVAEQFGLLEKGLRDPHQFAETLARLQALVGADRVGIPRVENSHRPDAFFIDPYLDVVPAEASHPIIGLPLLRFRPPLPAQVDIAEAQPAYVRSSRFQGEVEEVLGPWKLRGDWWNPLSWAREEWDIRTLSGLYRLAKIRNQWVIEGIYG